MGLTPMNSFKATCDEPECKAYINFGAPSGAVISTLRFHKWWSIDDDNGNLPAKVLCPAHKPEEPQ